LSIKNLIWSYEGGASKARWDLLSKKILKQKHHNKKEKIKARGSGF